MYSQKRLAEDPRQPVVLLRGERRVARPLVQPEDEVGGIEDEVRAADGEGDGRQGGDEGAGQGHHLAVLQLDGVPRDQGVQDVDLERSLSFWRFTVWFILGTMHLNLGR